MPELAAVRAVLPAWAGWSNLLLYLLLCLVATWAGLAIVSWLNHVRVAPDAHWSERARQLLPARRNVTLSAWLLLGEFVVLTHVAFGDLSPLPWGSYAAVVLVGLWLVATVMLWRFQRRWLGCWLTLGYYLAGQVTFLVVILPLLLIVVAMAVWLPAAAGLVLWSMVFAGILLMVVLSLGGGFYLVRLLGLARPAAARVCMQVEQAAGQAGIPLRGTYVVVSPMANAFALPFLGVVVFTDRAIRLLHDSEVLAVSHHEVGHLAEPVAAKLARLGPLLLFLVVGCWRPIHNYLGLWGLLVGLLLGLAINRRMVRAIHRREAAADAHVHAHADARGGADYARALERLHAANLVPAVLRRKRQTHPDLYDRMLAAGVTPDFERPEPPPRRRGIRAASLLVVVACVVLGIMPFVLVPGLASRSEAAALSALFVTGGNDQVFGWLAEHRIQDHPEEAVVLLRASVKLAPEDGDHRIRLAEILTRLGRPQEAEAVRAQEPR